MNLSMNQRERRKLAEKFETLAKDSKELAEALRIEDDTTVVVQYLIVAFGGQSAVKELGDIVKEEAELLAATKKFDKF